MDYLTLEKSHNSIILNELWKRNLDPGKFIMSLGYNLTSSYGFLKNKESREWQTAKNCPGTNNIILHLEGKKTIALPRHPASTGYWIDIDTDSHQKDDSQIIKRLEKVLTTLGKPLFAEHSPESGGYHLFYKFEKQIKHKNSWSYLNKYFKKEGFTGIEAVDGSKTLRLPFSESYTEYGIFEYDCSQIPVLPKLTPIPINELVDKVMNEYNYVPYVFTEIYSRIGDYAENSQIINEGAGKLQEKGEIYGKGSRDRNWFLLMREAVQLGKSLDECKAFVLASHDGTSKDIRKWTPQQIDENLNKLYYDVITWFQDNEGGFKEIVQSLTEENLNSYTPQEEVDELKVLIVETLESQLKYKGNPLKKKVEGAVNLYKAINYLYQKRLISEVKYSGANENLEKAVPLSQEMIRAIADKFNIPNINEMWALFNDLGIVSLLLNKDGQAYRWVNGSFPKHFVVNLISNIKYLVIDVYKYVIHSFSEIFRIIEEKISYKIRKKKIGFFGNELRRYKKDRGKLLEFEFS